MGDVITVNGIILSSMPMEEYDRRLVILTKERGKISAFAKGARRVNSHLCGVTRVFAMGTFELYEGRNSYSIRSATISNYFNELSSDFEAVYYGYYFAELAEYYTREGIDGKEYLNLMYCAFRALSAKNMPKTLIRYVYELRMLLVNGECPEFFFCAECTKEESLLAFSPSKYGLVCGKCLEKNKDAIMLDSSTVYTLQFIVSARLEKLFSFTVSDEVLTDLRMICGRLMSMSVDKKLKSLEVIDAVMNGI